MQLSGPYHSVVYLTLDAPARLTASGDGVRVRVLRDTGYPHDLRVSRGRPAVLKAGRVFTPVVDGHAELEFEAGSVGRADALVLCANCFAEMWRRELAWPPNPDLLTATERDFWADHSAHACPRCRAAAARPH